MKKRPTYTLAHFGRPVMDYKELLEKYNVLQREVIRLAEENKQLKTQLLLGKSHSLENTLLETKPKKTTEVDNSDYREYLSDVHNGSNTSDKVYLFMSLFKGRNDVYAKRWENKNKAIAGYSPVCLNLWRTGICPKPRIPCSKCENKSYAELDEGVIENHLRGNVVIGVYPMLADETCCFLAMDFDDEDWEKDISVLREVCIEFNIPVAVERSRSGKGSHVWFFFENKVSSTLARKLGTSLLTCSMGRRHEIKFKSYDRLFPSQDTIPKGGFGNLIALPLQKAAREKNNSEFIDESFSAYNDQWAFLSTVKRISEDRLASLVSELSPGNELGSLRIDEETVVVRNDALSAKYPGSVAAYHRKHYPIANGNICVGCFMGGDADTCIDDLLLCGLMPPDDFVCFDATAGTMWIYQEEIEGKTRDLGVSWLEGRYRGGYLWVKYDDAV